MELKKISTCSTFGLNQVHFISRRNCSFFWTPCVSIAMLRQHWRNIELFSFFFQMFQVEIITLQKFNLLKKQTKSRALQPIPVNLHVPIINVYLIGKPIFIKKILIQKIIVTYAEKQKKNQEIIFSCFYLEPSQCTYNAAVINKWFSIV